MKRLFKNQMKLLKALQTKKGREENGLFAVEGVKAVTELLRSGLKTRYLVFDQSFDHESFMKKNKTGKDIEVYDCDIDSVSTMRSSEGILAVAELPDPADQDDFFSVNNNLLGLFGISDPGNLGTLLRTARWFGFDGAVLYEDCADVYSQKVIRGSMGAVFSMRILSEKDYHKTAVHLKSWNKIGTFLDLESNFTPSSSRKTILFLGNESSGLKDEMKKQTDMNFRIDSGSGFDSLNVSVAGGIIMHELFRNGGLKC
ncbi:MAG: RNA methyltransferase [Candidatus Delongbacteria bacterium]|nr:RNA methyltransferase [Candidatus Delongbacteria bacterium]